MSGIIECAFIGRLGQDPELKTSAAGKSWCRLSLAVGSGEVQWVSVAIFGERAEHVCGTLRKNDKVYIEGAIGLNEWTCKDGKPRTGLSVVASRAEVPGIGRNKPKRAREAAANDTAAASDQASMLSA
jgi:single-strand DNA-binding protein